LIFLQFFFTLFLIFFYLFRFFTVTSSNGVLDKLQTLFFKHYLVNNFFKDKTNPINNKFKSFKCIYTLYLTIKKIQFNKFLIFFNLYSIFLHNYGFFFNKNCGKVHKNINFYPKILILLLNNLSSGGYTKNLFFKKTNLISLKNMVYPTFVPNTITFKSIFNKNLYTNNFFEKNSLPFKVFFYKKKIFSNYIFYYKWVFSSYSDSLRVNLTNFPKHRVLFLNTNVAKFVDTLTISSYTNLFLRKSKIFNKGRYSRNRQFYRTGVYWCLYLSIILFTGLYY
jgi:hypothetical protein